MIGAQRLLESRTDDLLVTLTSSTEACYLIGKHVGSVAESNLVVALVASDLGQIDITAADLNRIAELMRQYMGFPSASPTPPSSRPSNARAH